MFVSKYSPFIIASLSKEDIEVIANSSQVKSIVYYEDNGVPSEDILSETETTDESDLLTLDEYIESTGIKELHNSTGLTGCGVNIGIIDSGQVILSNYTEELPLSRVEIINNPNYYVSDHASKTAVIAAGNNGIASEAKIYSICTESTIYSAVEALLDRNVQLINVSLDYSTNLSEESQIIMEKWLDHIIVTQNVTVVKSAGNRGASDGMVSCPGEADNVITVGGYNVSDNVMGAYSSYAENRGGEKPELVAPDGVYKRCTSYTAPFVTGVIALMIEEKPFIAMYPELIKAILMASCHQKALPVIEGEAQEQMGVSLSEKQGAGIINPIIAIKITQNETFNFGALTTTDNKYSARHIIPKYNASGLRVAMSWLRNSYYDENNELIQQNRRNLNMSLNRNSILCGFGYNTSSSSETIYYTKLNNENMLYNISINYYIEEEYDENETVRYAYAWSTEDYAYSNSDDFEGLYYIKNSSSKRYLTIDNENDYYMDSAFIGGMDQVFVISNANTNEQGYRLMNAGGYGTGLSDENSIAVSSETPMNLVISSNEDGSYKLTRSNKCISYQNSNSQIVWSTFKENVKVQDWKLEKATYKIGDINMDGFVDDGDAQILDTYLFENRFLTNGEQYLADMDENNTINYADLSILYSIID